MYAAWLVAPANGIHWFGWPRQQAIDYMADNTALALHNVTTDVDRYISRLGQPLAYKVGEIKIRQLREWANQALGDAFDVRGFHQVVLGSGAVPLNVLEANVERWMTGFRQ